MLLIKLEKLHIFHDETPQMRSMDRTITLTSSYGRTSKRTASVGMGGSTWRVARRVMSSKLKFHLSAWVLILQRSNFGRQASGLIC